MSQKKNKGQEYKKHKKEEIIRFIKLRKAARVCAALASILATIIAVYSFVSALWLCAAVFVALALVSFYLVYVLTVDITDAENRR